MNSDIHVIAMGKTEIICQNSFDLKKCSTEHSMAVDFNISHSRKILSEFFLFKKPQQLSKHIHCFTLFNR